MPSKRVDDKTHLSIVRKFVRLDFHAKTELFQVPEFTSATTPPVRRGGRNVI